MTLPWRLPGVAYDTGLPGSGLTGHARGAGAAPGRRRPHPEHDGTGALAQPRERSPPPDGGDQVRARSSRPRWPS